MEIERFRVLKQRLSIPDFSQLPWEYGLYDWQGRISGLEDVPKGVSRHPVIFLEMDGGLYALKELAPGIAGLEFDILEKLETLNLPAVRAVACLQTQTNQGERSVLVTRFLEGSIPFRVLFMSPSLESYQRHLLDAIASLLVQLHLAGVFWGDCSLSNTLFRRDAGALRAYLVDAETAEHFPDYLPPAERFHDLQIMEESVDGDLDDLRALGYLPKFEPNIPKQGTGAYIRLRYQELWEQINVEELITPDENYRIQERVRALNELGFSVGDIELEEGETGSQLRLRVVVTDRNFHRDQLKNLSGLEVEELQAQIMMNEIQELRATLSQINNRSILLGTAALQWLDEIYNPVVSRLQSLKDKHTTLAELYCQLLEHKWYLSEQAHHDVGHFAAAEDFIQKFSAN